jgi:DNA-directed RNA polymerase subunit RPC12/RpoP
VTTTWDDKGRIVYKCDGCGATGVKLWREYQTIASHSDLLCAECAEKRYIKTHEGKSPWASGDGYEIGWMVPAVTTVEEDTFWGYTSTPKDRWDWWDSLPPEKPVPQPA